jgi:hypothetical protein
MKSKSGEQKVRERILSQGYGKFDLVEEILTKEEILNLKPRIVLKNISERLSLPEGEINRKTFWSWLRRYRQSNQPAIFSQINRVPIKDSIVNPLPEKPGQKWVEKFKPSIPIELDQTPVIIKIIKAEK